MLTVQRLFRPEGIVSDATAQVPLQTSAEFVRTYNAQAHEIIDAITAAVTRAQAGLNWLRAEPPDLEEVRQVLNFPHGQPCVGDAATERLVAKAGQHQIAGALLGAGSTGAGIRIL